MSTVRNTGVFFSLLLTVLLIGWGLVDLKVTSANTHLEYEASLHRATSHDTNSCKETAHTIEWYT